ncbi:MAG TPA: AAA family ATPase [Acidimicrobiales bacterium]|nr:AAA family ATPase [Acidimicrobiales bacterium]
MRELFVVVSGAPGSGKSTIAPPLARALDLPLLEKDVIKEALGDVLGADTLDDSKRLGAATMAVLLALARANVSGVLESTWIPELARVQLGDLPSRVVEIFVDVPVDEAMARYRARAGTRHPVHFDHQRLARADFVTRGTPIGGGWPVIRVDGTREVDIDALVRQILSA